MNDPRRTIPSVEKLLAAPELQPLLATEPRARVVAALRDVLERVRSNGAAQHEAEWYARAAQQQLHRQEAASLRAVVNATGVVLHTNLGRAPLSDAALTAIADTARDYANLEYDLEAGARGSRYHHCATLLCELTGAEAALVVNNNAAALVLALNTFAAGKQAIVSRGELVEIGGAFRVPDIMARSGAQLREIGSTNRTHLRDYADALSEHASAILKVHRSNFEMTGFVSEVSARELAALAAEHRVALIHDLGSGLLEDLTDIGIEEPTVRAAVAQGGILACSGDKLLGGPQAGILLGSEAEIARMRENPLCRALRVDKLTIAALHATLQSYARGTAREDIPVLRMLCIPETELRQRAQALVAQLASHGIAASIRPGSSAVGGGASPAAQLATWLVVLDPRYAANQLEARLRAADLPVVARIADDCLTVDLRTVPPAQDETLCQVLLHAAA